MTRPILPAMPPQSPLSIPRLSEADRKSERTWSVPGSKSLTNRALVLAALAEGPTRLSNVLASDDTRHMRACLAQLGIRIEDDGASAVIVHGGRSRLRPATEPLFVGNSGTTVRFLAGVAALIPGTTTFVGDQHMAKRPIADLVEGLRQLGLTVDCPTGCPPLTVHGGRLPGGHVTMRGDRSSQYFSALLLVAGLSDQPLDIHITGELVSRPYVDMTRRLVADFGGRIEVTADGFFAQPISHYAARSYHIEPDASAASYPFALAAAGGGIISVPNIGSHSLQGDYRFVEVLRAMGAQISLSDQALVTRVQAGPHLHGVEVDMHHISDTVMTLAAIAPLADSPTTIRNVANIRLKETDRLQALINELRRLGQEVDHGDDWLRITPRPLTAATVACYADHRMAMSFAVLGALTGAVTLADPACVAKTYPGFFADLAHSYAVEPWPCD